MNGAKYIGLDVHQATISAAVLDSTGKLVMESVVETKAATILQFVHGLRGSLWVTFEEGTWAAWLYDLLQPYVSKIVVCDPRRNAMLKEGSKSDRIDARKLAELLRGGLFSGRSITEKQDYGLQRPGDRDAQQCRIPLRGRSATTFEEIANASWSQ
jgi:hypothetical protein